MFLSNKNLDRIIKKKNSGTKLSIYIPTHPASTRPTLMQDTIRFKNALQIIKADKGYKQRELSETIKKMEALLKDATFWKHRTLGLAIFADEDGYETVDLNYEITDMQYIADDFVISPLAVMLSIGTGYYVLDINHTSPRLMHYTSHSKEEVNLEAMPGSFEQAVGRDEHQQHLQHQSAPRSLFHGQSESGAEDEDTLRYYKLIAGAVDEYLVDHDEPLLLAGAENRIGHMRPLLSYHNVIKEAMEGSVEDLNEEELEMSASAVIKKVDTVIRNELVSKVKKMPLSGLALGPVEVETAIKEGRVETLFLSAFRKTADNVREGDKEKIVLQLPEDIMRTESLVRGTLLQGGNVVAVKQGSFDRDEPRAICRF